MATTECREWDEENKIRREVAQAHCAPPHERLGRRAARRTPWATSLDHGRGPQRSGHRALLSPGFRVYVGMLGLPRATPWGYSLFEFEVYA
jgi:hypothetical protein